MARSNTGVPGLSFSWKRAIGLSRAESKISREIGVPLSRSGRERKFGRIMIHFFGWLVMAGVAVIGVLWFSHPGVLGQIAAGRLPSL